MPCMNTTTGHPSSGLTPPDGELPLGLKISMGIFRSATLLGTRLNRVIARLSSAMPGTVDGPAAVQRFVSGAVGSASLGGLR